MKRAEKDVLKMIKEQKNYKKAMAGFKPRTRHRIGKKNKKKKQKSKKGKKCLKYLLGECFFF